MKSRPFTLSMLVAVGAVACDGWAEAKASRSAHREVAPVTQVGFVDSALPPAVALRRFRAGLRDHPSALTGGATSRHELVQRFVRALETADTAALAQLILSRAEFAYLYYPSSKFSRPPYYLEPAPLWLLIQANSHKGAMRAVRRLGGKPFGFLDYRCAAPPDSQGENLLWSSCVVRHTPSPGDTLSERLFGSIIERDGQYKFVSYANGL